MRHQEGHASGLFFVQSQELGRWAVLVEPGAVHLAMDTFAAILLQSERGKNNAIN
jgi:hypothetical protein